MGYILQKPSGYYFRFQIPTDVKSLVNKSELRYSLQTRSIGLARSKARLLAGQMQSIIRSIRNGHMKELTDSQVNELIQTHIRRILKADEHERIMDDAPFDPDFHKRHIEIQGMAKDLLRNRLMKRDIDFITEVVDGLLQTEGITADKEGLPYRMLCREMFKAEAHILGVKQKREHGDYSNEPIPQVQPPAPTHEPTPSKTISQVMDDFFEEGDAENRWSARTRLEARASMQVLIDYFGDISINTINRRMMRQFKLDIMKLPPNMNKDRRYRGLTIHEVIGLKPEKTIAVHTINKYLGRVNSLFEYARLNGEISLNTAEGLLVRKTKRADEERSVFTPDELSLIFGSDPYITDGFRRSYMYWTPILAIFTGARQEEICSLRLKDFEQHEGIWCLNIVADDGKTLKNMASRRLIPLHPFLIDLGIMQRHQNLIENGETHFFPDLKPSGGRYGVYVSRWFNERYKKTLGLQTLSGKVFHSFRHTFGTNLSHNGIDDHSLRTLMGHSEDSITFGTYVKRGAPTKLYKALEDHLDYGISLDHLKGSKWTKPVAP